MLAWMFYVAFNRILVKELDERNLLKLLKPIGPRIKTFEVKGPK